MTLAIDAYEAAVKTWIEGQLGITAQVTHREGNWQGKTRARFHFMSSRAHGVDELRYAVDEDLEAPVDNVPTVNGVREITLSVLVQSRDQRPTMTAPYLLEKLRTSIKKPSIKAALYAAGLALSTYETVVTMDRVVDDRWESQASLDFHFNAVAIDRDEAEGISYVDKVGLTGVLKETPSGHDFGFTDQEFGNV